MARAAYLLRADATRNRAVASPIVATRDELSELQRAARQALAELSLCASAPAGAILTRTSRSRPESQRPRRVDDIVGWFRERFAAASGASELALVLDDARHELALLKARPDANVRTETLVELEARVIERGEGFAALDCAVGARTSEAIVRRARLKAGRDAEWGRRLPAEIVNGRPLTFGLGLVDAGFSIRAASARSGVARSTLFEHLPRTERMWRASA